jgi:nucleolar protein 53
MLATIGSVKVLRQTIDRTLTAREKARARRQGEVREKLKHGLIGRKLGKHKVQPGEVDVQLGEELSESLRALKVCFHSAGTFVTFTSPPQPEGNLFRDRFLSLQQRALVEPRVPVLYVSSCAY